MSNVLRYQGIRPVGGRDAKTTTCILSATSEEIGIGTLIVATTAGADVTANGLLATAILLGVSAQYKAVAADRDTAITANPEAANDPKYDTTLMLWRPDQRFYANFGQAYAATVDVVIPADIGNVFVVTGYDSIDADTGISKIVVTTASGSAADADAPLRLVAIPDQTENDLTTGQFGVGEFEFNMALTQHYGDTGGI